MPSPQERSKSKQEEILALFNKVVQPKPDYKTLNHKDLTISIYNCLDEKHEFNDKVRVELQTKLQKLKRGELDPNLKLTEGPFKGSTITWICAYIAASECSFPQPEREGLLGYPFLLRRIHDLCEMSGLDLSASFKASALTVSALWLAVSADLRDLKNDHEWFTEFLVQKLNGEQLRKLNINAMGSAEGIACSVLALMIKEDYASKGIPNYIDILLTKVSPVKYPQFYEFNKKVLDKKNMGMTTLCLAAQIEANEVKRNKPVSEKSAFLAIITKANIKTLDLNAPIIIGNNIGKTTLWYAAYIATGQVYEPFDVILEKADIDELNWNAKAQDPNDDDANSSVLWLASFLLANYRHGNPLLTILKKIKDISTLDFNNSPTTNKDGDKGKTVLWQCALAALNGKPGDDEALLIILNNSAKLTLDYSAKAVSGDYANQSVSDLIIQLAKEGNIMPLLKMLQDKNRPHHVEQQITPAIYAMMCVKLRELSLKRKYLFDFVSLFGVLLSVELSAGILNEVVPYGKFKGQTVFMQVLELALDGYPQLLDKALKEGSGEYLGRLRHVDPIYSMLAKIRNLCGIASMKGHNPDPMSTLSWYISDQGHVKEDTKMKEEDLDTLPQAESILTGFLSDRSQVQEYENMIDSVHSLLVQFDNLRLQADAQKLTASFDGKLKYTPSRWRV